eukprot:3290115-Rhodomonas_salina.1
MPTRSVRSGSGFGRSVSDSPSAGLHDGKTPTASSSSSGSGRFFGESAAGYVRDDRSGDTKSGRDVLREARDGADSESGSEAGAVQHRNGGSGSAQRAPSVLQMALSPTPLAEPVP